MKYYSEYTTVKKKTLGKRKVFDNNIYTFDIETSSYLVLDGNIIPACDYLSLNEDERERAMYYSNMYVWQFSINDTVYYGRTWKQLEEFLTMLELDIPERKILFIHNAAFEFQYLKSYFRFKDVYARISHKVMKAFFVDFNIEIRCSYMMSNCSLAYLPKLFNLPIKKLVGDLDYKKIRHSSTPLTDKELSYCEYDCLVVYHYILVELDTYENVDKIPITSTGHVRKELKELIQKDYNYKNKVYKAININPHIYNMLQEAFMGGYTHANWIYADEVLNNVDSWDFTSSYPYVLVTHRYPATEFRQCNIRQASEMLNNFAYLIKVKFNNIKSKYYNNIISQSKAREIVGGKYDNGRIMSATSLELTLTDIDFRLILDWYDIESYEILESYSAIYDYLPKQFINFVLQKYVNKTQFKGVPEKEVEYSKEKNKFNALYGMSVTNTIRDNVVYDNDNGWEEIPLSNDEIIEKLLDEKKKSFLSFAYGCWVTAYARSNLLRNVMKLDEYVVYCDTDSMKLIEGYDKIIIDNYNTFVDNKIKHVSKVLDIPFEKFAPTDIYGVPHMLGVFEDDGHYTKFITQGAKKYCVEKYHSIYGFKRDFSFKKEHTLAITVAGVPKSGVNCLKRIEDFKDDLMFTHEETNKNLLIYCDDLKPIELTDYLGNKLVVNDKSGCCLVPTTYVLGKSQEYQHLLSYDSSERSVYKE